MHCEEHWGAKKFLLCLEVGGDQEVGRTASEGPCQEYAVSTEDSITTNATLAVEALILQ